MAEGKWIRGLTADTPLIDAARRVIEARLGVVAEFLPRAVAESHRDIEFVHQLRVGTRRADAALQLFRDCLAGRAYKSARARLRGIRRAAGAARDWDVFLAGVRGRTAEAESKELPGFDCLSGMALGQRVEAQRALASAETDFTSFAEFAASVTSALREPEGDDATLGELAGPTMSERFEELRQAASGDLNDYEHLHQVRIAGKRLRYAMEILADCFPPAFRDELYPLVEEMQEMLGRANDSHVAGVRLAALREQLRAWPGVRDRVKPGLDALSRFHQRRLPQERRRFVKWWEKWAKAAAGMEGSLRRE